MPHNDTYDALYSIVTRLRAPDGCPWDRKQTLEKMITYLLEESYETVSAVQEGDEKAVREELGDVFLILAMMARILEERDPGAPADIFSGICSKLIRRHPHVFGDEDIDDPDEVKKKWDEIKETVEGRERKSGVHAVSTGYPPLERSLKIQKLAAEAGFDWPDYQGPLEKVREELQETETAALAADAVEMEAEIGDLLFSVVNLSRKLKVDPMTALHRTNEKFLRRYAEVERRMSELGAEMHPDRLETMDRYWNEAKLSESRSPRRD